MPTTTDAVVVLPGIMGSRLVDRSTGATLWGFDEPSLFVEAWLTGGSLADLAVTDAERGGDTSRVQATGLLSAPAYAPGFLGLDKYSKLVATARKLVRHDSAVLEFGYDWRLSIAHNAGHLADAATQHLDRWRSHSEGRPDAQLVLVAHSMGGLVARYFTAVLGGDAIVRKSITMGTPFYGSVKSAYMMATGRGAPVPLPHVRMKHLIRTMPGMHDLLPFYRCVRSGDQAAFLIPSEVAALGGDSELATEALNRHRAMMSGSGQNLRLLVGVDQPTMQSLQIDGGVAAPIEATFDPSSGDWFDRAGDTTVPRASAGAFGLAATTLLQSHGSLPSTAEAGAAVRDIVLLDQLGAPLDSDESLGLRVPDVVSVDTPILIAVEGVSGGRLSGRLTDVRDGRQVAILQFRLEGGRAVARVSAPAPGLYRVGVRGPSAFETTQIVMVTPAAPPVMDEA